MRMLEVTKILVDDGEVRWNTLYQDVNDLDALPTNLSYQQFGEHMYAMTQTVYYAMWKHNWID